MREGTRVRYVKDREFAAALRQRAAAYFASATWPRNGDRPLQVYVLVVTGTWWASYLALVFVAESLWIAAPALTVLVLFSPAVAVTGHSLSHGMLDRTRAARLLARYTTISLGFDEPWWTQKHNHLHHRYTNVFGLDDDLDQRSILRLSARAPWRPHHRYQWLYAWALYLSTHLAMIVAGEVRYMATGRIGGRHHERTGPRGYAVWIFHKAIAASVLFGIPASLHPVGTVALVFLAWSAAFSLILSVIFQTSHCVGDRTYPQPDPRTGVVPVDWRIAQILGTVDVAARNPVFTWLYGGLSLHVAHHLFPGASPTHYRGLTGIVRGLAEARGIRYRSYPTLRSAIRAHHVFLRTMGQPNGVGLRAADLAFVGPEGRADTVW